MRVVSGLWGWGVPDFMLHVGIRMSFLLQIRSASGGPLGGLWRGRAPKMLLPWDTT